MGLSTVGGLRSSGGRGAERVGVCVRAEGRGPHPNRIIFLFAKVVFSPTAILVIRMYLSGSGVGHCRARTLCVVR
jgi:hypothetical protein